MSKNILFVVTGARHWTLADGSEHPTGFWAAEATSGSDPVGPGDSTRFELLPTRYIAAPPHGQWWIVDAYSSAPDALSTSPLQHWTLDPVPY